MKQDVTIDYLEELGVSNPGRLVRSAVAEIYETGISVGQVLADPDFGGSLTPEQRVAFRVAIEVQGGLNVVMPEMGPGIALHREDWISSIEEDIDWFHWRRFESVLRAKNLPIPAVKAIGDTSLGILGAMPRPLARSKDSLCATTGGFNQWRGLVVGHVQSGKTANFTALICRAADVGFQLFIVLGGMLNSLRFQTQTRLCAEILGEPDGQKLPLGRVWHELTTSKMDGDFQESTSLHSRLQLGNPPTMAVIKKNVSVMQSFNEALEEFASEASQNGTLEKFTVLVVDDESDEASINTGKKEKPSSTNAELRRLLNIFPRTAYIGFTATPYANCFIPPGVEHDEYQLDVYPKDFILPLEASDQYVSSDRVFGRKPVYDDGGKMPVAGVFQVISPGELSSLIPPSGKHPDGTPRWKSFEPKMTESLRRAVLSYLLAGAARIDRGEGDEHATMLVNVSRHPAQHGKGSLPDEPGDDLQDRGQVALIRDLVGQVTSRFRGGNGLKKFKDEFGKIWRTDFVPTISALGKPVPEFEVVCASILEFAEDVQFLVINGDSEDSLDFRRGPPGNPRPPVKAVIVGGQALGRGLTLEGLLCTYFTRESGNMATAVQMQRWCGYRKPILDLMKVYTTEDVAETYRYAIAVEEEMRLELKKYERDKVRPDEVRMLLRQHPDIPLTTGNKRGSAIVYDGQYSGRIPQTTTFEADHLAVNLETTRTFVSSLNERSSPARVSGPSAILWSDLPHSLVVEYLKEYRHPDHGASSRSFNGEMLGRYIEDQVKKNKHLVDWTVALCGPAAKAGDQHQDDLGDLENTHLRMRSVVAEKDSGTRRIGIITDPEHENLDLDSDTRGATCREKRDPAKGLLLIYPIRSFKGSDITVVGLAISFSAQLKDQEVPRVVAGGRS